MEMHWDIVPLGESRMFASGSYEHKFADRATRPVVKAVRLDVIIDDGPDGFSRGFAHLLAGLRLRATGNPLVQNGAFTNEDGLTFVNAIPGAMLATPADLDKPTMRHAVIGPLAKDWELRNGTLQLHLEYRGPSVPVAFMRVVPTGIAAEPG